MQIYLPYKNFVKIAKVLSDEDLLKQRDNAEEMMNLILYEHDLIQINKSKSDYIRFMKIKENPIYNYWWNNGKPFCLSLLKYIEACSFELFNRGQKLKKYSLIKKIIGENFKIFNNARPQMPNRITKGYRIVLLCCNEEFYKNKFNATYRNNLKTIKKLQVSEERFKYAKFLKLEKGI